MKSKEVLLSLGICMPILVTFVIYNSNYGFARNSDAVFEVIDCTVRGNSTFQQSGPCPSPGVGLSLGKSMTESQNKLDNGIGAGSGMALPILADSNPFASIS